MEPITLTCARHQNPNELYCTSCNSYLCPECITEHDSNSHKANYLHILQYAPQYALPKLDKLLESAPEQAKTAETEFNQLSDALRTMMPHLKELTDAHTQAAEFLKSLASQLTTYSKQKAKGSFTENIKSGLVQDKERLQKLLTERKPKEVLKLAQKIDEEAELSTKKISSSELIGKLETNIKEMEKVDPVKEVIAVAGKFATKYRLLRVVHYTKDWKCDRQYLSTKMYLSEDGLIYGNTASNGYPAIIGDVPFETGLYAFEVIPESLDCTGREGFGIIERDKYLAAYAADPTTPTVYNEMIGFLYRNDAKNMTVERMRDMQMGSKYFVRVNMFDLYVKITGPGLSLRADLKPGTVYAPCFSCGCSNNRLRIRPLEDFDEPDPSESQ